MLKAGGRGEVNGKPVEIMIIGLSHQNLEYLRAGHPIMCKAKDFGCTADIEITIFAGTTEQAMTRELVELIDPETEIVIDPRLRD